VQLRDAREYRFERLADGFRIVHPERSPVALVVKGSLFEVDGFRGRETVVPTLHLRDLCHKLGAMLLRSEPAPIGRSVEAWMLDAWAIAPAVARERERLLARIPAEILDAQSATIAACGERPVLQRWPVLEQNPYILSDVQRFRAAAIALTEIENDLAQRRGEDEEDTQDEFLRRMEQWRGVFAAGGTPYKALNRTLTRLANDVPDRLLPNLANFRLQRTITDSLELTALLVHSSSAQGRLDNSVRTSRDRLYQDARRGEIVDAVLLVGNALHRRLNPHVTADLATAIHFLNDFPRDYSGRLPGLARRAIQWHRDARYRVDTARVAKMGGRSQPTARPPIPLPADERIRFLDTVGAVVDEGDEMEHCIGGYAAQAVAGFCYLFHVDYDDRKASFEISPHGHIRQGHGPRNCDNEAVRWGQEQLHTWAAAMRPESAAEPPAPSRALHRQPGPIEPRRPRRRRSPRVDPRQLPLPFAAQENE